MEKVYSAMEYLDKLESGSIYVIREGYHFFPKTALLWSIGKDSTTLLWLIRKAFFGTVPFPVLHIDTTFKFPEMYTFRDKISKKWELQLRIAVNKKALRSGISYQTHDALTCCHELKTLALKQAIRRYKLGALYAGIRSDEHGIRAKERIFSPRNENFTWDYLNQPAELWNQYKTSVPAENHVRIHPLLQWTEVDIWKYIKREKIPVNPLYFSRNGYRYRSLGCKPVTKPVRSEADTVDKIISELEETGIPERSGRSQDKEDMYAMQKLRALGYL